MGLQFCWVSIHCPRGCMLPSMAAATCNPCTAAFQNGPTLSTTARAQESLPPLLISHCICSTTDLRPCHHFKPQHSKTVDHEHGPEGHCGLPEGVVMEGAEFRQRVLNEDGSINSGKAFERERVMRASLACTFVPESPEQTGRLKQGPCWPRSAEG